MVKDYDLTQPLGFEITAYRSYTYGERSFNNIYLSDFINESFMKSIEIKSERQDVDFENFRKSVITLPYEFKFSSYLTKVELSNPLNMSIKMLIGKGSISSKGKLPDFIKLLLERTIGIGEPIGLDKKELLESKRQNPEF
jgi:hypothetical protein